VRLAAAATPRPDARVGAAGTLLVHAAAVGLLLLVVQAPPPPAQVYAVELVAAPAPTAARRVATEAVARPPVARPMTAPTPAPPRERAAPAPKARPQPPAPSRAAAPDDREPPPRTASTVEPLPGEAPGTGTDVANLRTPGLAFPYPEYLRNIVNEVYRRWSPPAAALRAELSFLILRDGSVKSIGFVQRSGNFAFDLDAQGAIEAAGNARAFGPLPDGWPADVLPVTIVFEPRR